MVGAIHYMIDNFVPPASSSSLRVSQCVMAKNEALYAFVYVFVQTVRGYDGVTGYLVFLRQWVYAN